MAKSNKYSSVNFNDIYDNANNKKNPISLSPSSSSSSSSTHPTKSYSFSASSNGGMLVLSRPPPKPTSISSPSPPSEPDAFSLRPQGKTPSPILERQIKEVSPVPKTDKFVPPHLRPGYVVRDNHTHVQSPGNYRPGSGHGYGEDGRPNSGGGYDRRIRPVGADLIDLNRPRSGPGSRPSSTGWY